MVSRNPLDQKGGRGMSDEALDPAEVGRRLRIARETAGMTQARAAARIDVASRHCAGARLRRIA